MVDKTLPNLDAVVTPVATDILLTRQAADTEDRRYTRAQIYTLLSGEHFVLPQVDEPATPTLAFGDGDTGFYESADDTLNLATAGFIRFGWDTSGFFPSTASGFLLDRDVPSATDPNIIPNRTDTDTGLSRNADDQLSLVSGGVEMLRLVETGLSTTDQLLIAPAGIIGAAATPALAFGDGDSGFYESADDTLKVTVGGAATAFFDVLGIQ